MQPWGLKELTYHRWLSPHSRTLLHTVVGRTKAPPVLIVQTGVSRRLHHRHHPPGTPRLVRTRRWHYFQTASCVPLSVHVFSLLHRCFFSAAILPQSSCSPPVNPPSNDHQPSVKHNKPAACIRLQHHSGTLDQSAPSAECQTIRQAQGSIRRGRPQLVSAQPIAGQVR